MGGVYIQLSFIDTVINFGQGVLAFLVLGLDPEAFLMPLRKMWVNWENMGEARKRVCELQKCGIMKTGLLLEVAIDKGEKFKDVDKRRSW